MKPRHRLVAPLLGLSLILAPAVLQAQIGLGAHIGYDMESEEALAGVDVQIPLKISGVPKTVIAPALEVLLTSAITVIYANTSVRFFPWSGKMSKVDPYFGPGLALAYDDFSEEVSISFHAVAGLAFALSSGAPFVQAQFSFGDFDQTALVAGWMFSF
jgi:hypothetical protein